MQKDDWKGDGKGCAWPGEELAKPEEKTPLNSTYSEASQGQISSSQLGHLRLNSSGHALSLSILPTFYLVLLFLQMQMDPGP